MSLLLLVEDDRDDIELTLLGFKTHGFTHGIAVARDGIEALARLRGGRPRPAAVLTDIKMPRMDGIELLRRLKSDPRLRAIPVMILSSSGRHADKEEALRCGAADFLRKPADLDDYGEIVRRVLEAMGKEP